MSRVIVHVNATAGPPAGLISLERPCLVGWGQVRNTLAEDTEPAEALVIMWEETAPPGGDVVASPVAVIHLQSNGPHDLFLCVPEDRPFVDSPDPFDLHCWDAAPDHRGAALHPGHRQCTVTCGSQAEADRLLADAQHQYLLSTGCLD